MNKMHINPGVIPVKGEEARAFLQEYPDFSEMVRIVEQRDKSIYEGMNQATAYAEGKFLYLYPIKLA